MRLAAAALLLAGCAGVATKPPKPDRPAEPVNLDGRILAVAGETIEYQVELRGITVGRVQVGVGKPGWVEDRPAIIVRSRGTSAGIVALIGELRWELTTTLDLQTGSALD